MPTYPSSLSCYAVYDPAGRPKPATPSYQASYDRSLYFPYGGRPDYRHDPRGLPQSTPIHDVELDSHAGSKRQRTTIAVGLVPKHLLSILLTVSSAQGVEEGRLNAQDRSKAVDVKPAAMHKRISTRAGLIG